MRKTILAILAILILGGGAFAAKIVIDRPNDPQEFVNTALVNSFEINSAKFESTVQITAKSGETDNGQLAITMSGNVTNATEYLPTLNLQMNLEAAVNVLGQAMSGKVNSELKIVDEVFYGKLGELMIEGAEGLGLPTETIEPFIGKWYAISFAKLKESDPTIAEVFEEQKAQQTEMRENLKNLIATSDLLLVKKMPISLNDLQPVEVVLNTDLLTSDAFLAEMEKMFTPAGLPEDTENPFEIDEEQRAKIQEAIKEFTDKIDSTIILQIDRESGILHGYSAVISLNLADLGLPQAQNGEVSITINSQNFEINEPQIIEAPTEFEEIDPLQLLPTPTTEDEYAEDLDNAEDELEEEEVQPVSRS